MPQLLNLQWDGPYSLYQNPPARQIDDIAPKLAGVYLWAVPIENKCYPYYVGESDNLRSRLATHRGNLTGGYYWVYCPDALREGRLEAVYNPNTDQRAFDKVWDKAKDFTVLLRFFILPFPPDASLNTKRVRLRTELRLAQAIAVRLRRCPGVGPDLPLYP